ncbi:MAG: indolepyruvate oxidoreductase subunit beta [Sulfolobales archaeon]
MREIRELNILVTGIGGQGQLFLSRLIGEIFVRAKTNVYIAETHGLSQRGGSVVVHIRIGRMVRAPLIPLGRGHIMVSLELIEAARNIEYLNSDSVILANMKLIRPPGQRVEISEDRIIEFLRSRVRRLYLLRASEKAVELKMPISANIYMIGSLVKLLDSVEILNEYVSDMIVEELLPKKNREVNIEIYNAGKREIEKLIQEDDIAFLKKLFFTS